MSTTKIAVVAAVSRPHLIPQIEANFLAQRYPHKELVFCLNGDAATAKPSIGVTVVCEGGTPARPRNAGLSYLKGTGIELVAFWDDDDGYRPWYLTETVEALEGRPNRVTGKYARYTRYDDGVYCLLGRQASFLGGTMGGWVRALPPIPDLARDEDLVWCRQMEKMGFELFPLGGLHYVYYRLRGPHAWWTTKTLMLHTYGPALSLGQVGDEVADHPPGRPTTFIPKTTMADILAEQLATLEAKPIRWDMLGLPE